ncbi:hypothetical protein PAHAL_2G326200 [Panicum hallii]|jgi:hypothetical protein|uniref:Uncharacterized protein n=1 Tax=Panicum hallii TaxID=206008 RepID=A0A2T8KR70_9POAL|nr:hypothetical protein PAHAL_2G326200 [Panicum hallii]
MLRCQVGPAPKNKRPGPTAGDTVARRPLLRARRRAPRLHSQSQAARVLASRSRISLASARGLVPSLTLFSPRAPPLASAVSARHSARAFASAAAGRATPSPRFPPRSSSPAAAGAGGAAPGRQVRARARFGRSRGLLVARSWRGGGRGERCVGGEAS